MLDTVCNSIVSSLSASGINAVRKYPPDKLDADTQTVCVSLKSATITASGLGNYIGLCTENGTVKEMYGSRAELVLSFELYSPTPDCDELRDVLFGALNAIASLSVKSTDAGEVRYDGKSGMFCCECTAKAYACLVRQLSDYGLDGDDE